MMYTLIKALKIGTTLILILSISACWLFAQEYASGDAGIDRVRSDVKNHKTTEENFRQRHLMLYMWMGALQQQGADTHSYFILDQKYYELEPRLNKSGKDYDLALKQICEVIDEGFVQMEKIQKDLIENGPHYTAFQNKSEVQGGDYSAEWPIRNIDCRKRKDTCGTMPIYFHILTPNPVLY